MIFFTSWRSHFPGRWPPGYYMGITGSFILIFSPISHQCPATRQKPLPVWSEALNYQWRTKVHRLKIFGTRCPTLLTWCFCFPRRYRPLLWIATTAGTWIRNTETEGRLTRREGPKISPTTEKMGGGYPKWGNREVRRSKWLDLNGWVMMVPFNDSDQPMCRQDLDTKRKGGQI